MCGLVAVDHAARVASLEGAVVLASRFALRPGHLLVAASRHAERFSELGPHEASALYAAVDRAARALEREALVRRVHVAFLGSASARDVSFPHLHAHVVPLFDGGPADRPSEVLTWERGVTWLSDGALLALAARLAPAIVGHVE
jgi:diadenosine tetraphosphate (Ap4A) HIT family hydrolase